MNTKKNDGQLPGKKATTTETKRHDSLDAPSEAITAPGSSAVPDADLHRADANVGLAGECIVPPHPESVRTDTGAPCDDGRAGVRE